jgi:hypothetical protein
VKQTDRRMFDMLDREDQTVVEIRII